MFVKGAPGRKYHWRLMAVSEITGGLTNCPFFASNKLFSGKTKKYLGLAMLTIWMPNNHDDVIKWKHFPRYWPFVRGIHRSPVNSPHKDQWRGSLMFSLICAWINRWVRWWGAATIPACAVTQCYHLRHCKAWCHIWYRPGVSISLCFENTLRPTLTALP